MAVFVVCDKCGKVTPKGETCPRCGAPPVRCHERAAETGELVSFGSAISPEQVPEFQRQFGPMGVRYDAKTGNAHYENRRAKLRVLKARGFHDREEVCG